MQRRSRHAELALAILFGSLLSAAPLTVARAEWNPTGSVTTGMLVLSGSTGDGSPALGGGLAVDLWQSFGALRLGLYSGLHIVGGTDTESMIFTPVAASLAVALETHRSIFEIRIRGGGYGGAVFEQVLVGGAYLGTGVFFDFAITERAAVGVGAELHILLGTDANRHYDSRAFFSPSLTLVYRPESTPDDD